MIILAAAPSTGERIGYGLLAVVIVLLAIGLNVELQGTR